ncbi:hypothetical protein CVT26_016019 [Gymnopilus dilepis]|uniref:Uncharacterized protein n=1 Tax=Gymnopilus dilepis TaxID=231916 RepID=A0A409YDI3_9AGAR|nr:hypothetical protein CVT26_016019 [Gymnopilus dilepis]
MKGIGKLAKRMKGAARKAINQIRRFQATAEGSHREEISFLPSRAASGSAPLPNPEISTATATNADNQTPEADPASNAGHPSAGALPIYIPYIVPVSTTQDSFNITKSSISRMNTYHTYHTHHHYHFVRRCLGLS